MNHQLYRVIFSKVSGTFIAVAEIAKAQGTKRKRNRRSKINSASLPLTRLTTLSVLIAAVFIHVTPVHAQMVAYKNGAGPRPLIDQSANGRTIVQIVNPNATGLSHNKYDQFNVDSNGVILNNSPTNVNTQLAGYIQGNPQIDRSANIILNEVLGTHRSQLQGYIEVAGQRAEVVVANPNGISIGNGAGFINTSRAVLTTGTPTFGGDGSLAGFRVTQGDIKIGSDGMNATQTDQLDLLARSIQVNDAIWANRLNARSGANQVDYNSLGVTVIEGAGGQATVALDSSALGGMYAQKITFIGTEKGVGVNLSGDIVTSAGDLNLDNAGKITIHGKANASGQIAMNAAEGLTNNGTVYGQQAVTITSNGQVINNGTLAAKRNLAINAASIHSSGVIGAGISDSGDASEAGNLLLTASGAILTTGQNSAGGNIVFTGSQLHFAEENTNSRKSATTSAHGSVILTATEGDINHQEAALTAGGSAILKAAGNINNDAGVIQANHLELTGDVISNMAGELLQSGAGNAHITALDSFNNTNGTVASSNDLYLQAGSLVSHGRFYTGRDAMISVQSDITLTDDTVFRTNRDFIFTTSGTLTNTTDLESVGNLTLNAANIMNMNGALINSGNGSTILNALLDVYNIGRIYGNDIAIQASRLMNDGALDSNGNTLQAGVIAARNDLDLGVDTLMNREHAVLQSLGNITIGNALDENHHATGQASYLQNASATIDAGGDLNLQVAKLDNLNLHFVTELQRDESLTRRVRYYMMDGSPVIYVDGIDAKIINEDEIDKLYIYANGTDHNDYTIFDFLETTDRTVVLHSDPGRLMAGGKIILAGEVNNDKSMIVAGGAITGDLSKLTNSDASGTVIVTRNGYKQYHTTSGGGWTPRDDDYHDKEYFNDPVSLTQDLKVVIQAENQRPDHLNNDAIGADVEHGDVPNGDVDVNTPIKLPESQLFPITTNPNANYLIETDPKFTNYANFLSSDYMLNRLGMNPSAQQKRLGDGFYEQKLINDQILQLTGKRFLGDYSTNEQQYQALMESGIKVAEQFQLTPGIALTAEQMAALTSDMVWLVSKEVVLPDGSKQNVLVPVVYLAKVDTLQANGAIISGRDIALNVDGTVHNAGTLQANHNALIKATNITNTGTLRSDASAGNTVLVAEQDILNQGGLIAGNSVVLSAGRDVVIASTISENKNSNGTGFNSEHNIIDKVASVDAGQLHIQSGRDINLTAAQIDSQGNANIAAGRDLNLETVTTKDKQSFRADDKNSLNLSQTNVVGTQISSGGNLSMSATQDINAKAAYVNSNGELSVMAGRDINLESAKQESSYDQQTYNSSSGLLSSSTRYTESHQYSTQSVGTTLSGDKVQIMAGNNINVAGSNVASTNDLNVIAGNNINVTTSEDHAYQSYRKEETTSGLFSSGGVGVTLGSKSQDDRSQDSSTFHQGSLIGSVVGNVTLVAGNDLSIKGSDVIAQKDINLAGRNVEVTHVQNELRHAEQHEMEQSGLTLSVSSPITNVATSVVQGVQRGKEVEDSRLEGLYAAKAATELWTNYDGIKNEAAQLANGNMGSVSINLSIGSSQSSSSSDSQLSYAQGSRVNAGGNLNVIATGQAEDAEQGNIHISGSQLDANNIALNAANDILIQSAQSTQNNKAENDSSGWSAGVGISLGQQTGITFSASGYQGSGNQNGNGTEQLNSQVNAQNGITIVSGRDTTLQGAVVSGKQITADVGRNLTITSLQDKENYQSQQENMSAGASFTYGTGGGSASFSMNQSSTDADYASVKQQSGLYAGEGGFNVKVGNHTQLNGGAISSSATPDKNNFSTGSLGVADITNHKNIDSQADGFGIGTGASAVYEAGKAAVTALASSADEQGSASSQTRATISNGNVEISSGDTQALDKVNRDTSTAHNPLQNYNVQQIAQDTQNSSEAGQVIASTAMQFTDKAHESLFGTENGSGSKLYRVVCKQEPCTYDPAIQSDPNRKDKEGNPNVVMMELSEQEINSMSEGERKGIVLATNGIMNDVQRAGELALQNADATKEEVRDLTGNSKPEVLLANSPHSGNIISEGLVAGYEVFLAKKTGYSDADYLMADNIERFGIESVALGHSRGSAVLDNALQILDDRGVKIDSLKVQVTGPAVSQERLTETTGQLRTSDDIRLKNPPEYNYFPNDPVSTFIGHSSNGDWVTSLLEIFPVMTSPNSAHSCGGTGIAGCKGIEKPYSYNGLNPADLQKLRQEQVDRWLRQGTEYAPVVNPANGLLTAPVYFQKNPTWGAGVVPLVPQSSTDERVDQLRTSIQK